MKFQNIMLTVISFTIATSAVGQQFTDQKVKRIFSGILIGSSGSELSSTKLLYEQELLKKSTDTSVYIFWFQDVFPEETEVLTIEKRVFVNIKERASLSEDNQEYQKLLDFGMSTNDQWKTNFLFRCNTATIVFERKNWDNLIQDTLYRFKVSGQRYWSHVEPITRIYATKKLGIVRVDSTFEPQMLPSRNKFEKAIFVSNDYIKRSRLKDYFKKGLLRAVD
jgi:hypothetical protein